MDAVGQWATDLSDRDLWHSTEFDFVGEIQLRVEQRTESLRRIQQRDRVDASLDVAATPIRLYGHLTPNV